jgi:PPOX class probable F420-dependent enzyme
MARMRLDVLAMLLEQPIIAVLATLRRNGMPYQVPVWFLWHDEAFWLTGTYARLWCRHLFADPRCALCIETTAPVARYVAVECEAAPVEPKQQDIWPVSRLLVEKYIGTRGGDVEGFLARMRTEPRLLFRLTPRHWRAIDLTVYTSVRGDRRGPHPAGSGG